MPTSEAVDSVEDQVLSASQPQFTDSTQDQTVSTPESNESSEDDALSLIRNVYCQPTILEAFTPGNVFWLSKIIDASLPKQLGSVLDIGCGSGGVLNFVLSQHPELTTVVGIDIAPKMIEWAQKHHTDARPVIYINDDFKGHEFTPAERPPQGFEGVIALYVGQYVGLKTLIAKIFTLAAPGASILIIDKIMPTGWMAGFPMVRLVWDFVKVLVFHITHLHTLPPKTMFDEGPAFYNLYRNPDFLTLSKVHQKHAHTFAGVQEELREYKAELVHLASDVVLIRMLKPI